MVGRCSILSAACVLAAASFALPGDWQQFRGPGRDGKSEETGLSRMFGPTGARELFRVPIGAGFASVSVVGERLFTMDSDGSSEYALCLDAVTGETLWRVAIGPVFEEIQGDGPRSTPTVDGDRVFVLGSRGRLAALERETGETLWELELSAAFGSELPTWAFSSAPMVDGERLIVEVGGSAGRAVAALEKATGEVVWTSQSSSLAYSSPIQVSFAGAKQYVFLLQDKLTGLDTEGRELWSVPFEPRNEITPASPVFIEPDLILASASYDIGAKVVRLSREGDGVTATEVWSGRQMRNHFNATVALDGHVYGFDTGTLRCLDARTGEPRWAKRGLGKGSLISADGMLVVLSERGKLVLVEATPDAYRELGSLQVLEGRSWTPPSLANGRLYLRNHTELVSVELKP